MIEALQRTAPVLPMIPGTPERRSYDHIGYWHHPPVCRAEHRYRQGHRQAVRLAPGRRLPRLPRRDRPPGRARPGDPRHLRQPLRATRRPSVQRVAAGSPPRPAGLHPDLPLLDVPGRTVPRRAAAPRPRPWRVLLPRRANHRTRRWIDLWNATARPFKWTNTADEIIDRIRRDCSRIAGLGRRACHAAPVRRLSPPVSFPGVHGRRWRVPAGRTSCCSERLA